MSETERYEPSAEEMARAEAAMTPEQQAASAEREALKFQERAPFADETGKMFSESPERKQPTAEDRRRMDQDMADLSRMTAGSDARWSIDGARNISLMNGDYIGVHKDVDISIDKDDLAKLDASLSRAGYGLFMGSRKDSDDPLSPKILERMGAAELAGDNTGRDVSIMAIDEKGKLREVTGLNSVDVHIVRRDAEGYPIGPGGNRLPKEWFEPQKMKYQGHELNISHPANVAYFKLRQGRPYTAEDRPYDSLDLKLMIDSGSLSGENIEDVAQVYEQEMSDRQNVVEGMADEIAARLRPEMTAMELARAVTENPVVAGRISDAADPRIQKLVEMISDPSARTPERLKEAMLDIFGIAEAEARQRGKIDQLRQWKEDRDRIEELRQELGSAG